MPNKIFAVYDYTSRKDTEIATKLLNDLVNADYDIVNKQNIAGFDSQLSNIVPISATVLILVSNVALDHVKFLNKLHETVSLPNDPIVVTLDDCVENLRNNSMTSHLINTISAIDYEKALITIIDRIDLISSNKSFEFVEESHLKRIYLSTTDDPVTLQYRHKIEEIIGGNHFSSSFKIVNKDSTQNIQLDTNRRKQLISNCDIYISLSSPFYGKIHEPSGLSYNEYDYNSAVEHGLKILLFVLPDDILNDTPPNIIIQQSQSISRQQVFKQRTDAHVIANVASLDELSEALQSQIKIILSEPSKVVPSTLIVGKRSWVKENWGEAPSADVFYGREAEIVELKDWILTDRCRMILLLAMGGMGKTTLAVKVVQQVKQDFDILIWRSLQNAPPLEDILRYFIHISSNFQQVNLPHTIDEQITLLIEYLRSKRILLILDNIETILQGGNSVGQYRAEYEEFGKLFTRIGQSEHNSCLILTGREKPREIALMEGKTTPVRTKSLDGLSPIAAEYLLKDRKLNGGGVNWSQLVQHYSGNPLALKLVATTIQELFSGDIDEFLSSGIILFGDIQDIVGDQFERLSLAEKEIMYWLCIERDWITIENLQANISHPVNRGEILSTLLYLQRRSIIEKNEESAFFVQPVILEYVTNQIIDIAYTDIINSSFDFLANYSLVQAQAKDYVRHTQNRLILDSIIDRLLAKYTLHELENTLHKSLTKVRGVRKRFRYFAGNIINLLVRLGIDLTDYDFSELEITQVYLRDINLYGVNMTSSDLNRCVFTETFGSVLAVTFSPTGDRLAIGGASGEIRIWELSSNKLLHTLQGHTDWIRFLIFSPDGDTIYSCSEDQTVRSWDAHKGISKDVMIAHKNRVRTIALDSTGKYLASASEDHTVIVWNTDTSKPSRTLIGHKGPVRGVAFSPDDRLIASCSDDSLLKIWDTYTGECLETLQGHQNQIWSVAFSPDGKLLASGGEDGLVKLWNTDTWQPTATLEGHSKPVRSVNFSPDGHFIVSGSEDQTVRLWDLVNDQNNTILRGHTSRIRVAIFSPDGKLIASGSEDQTVRLWETVNSECIRSIQGYNNRIWSVAYSPSKDMIASGGDDSIVRIWETSESKVVLQVPQSHQIRWLTYSLDGRLLAIASEDQNVELINVDTGNSFSTLKGHTARARTAMFHPLEGNLLLTGGDDQVLRLWNINRGECIRVYRGHTGWIRAVAFNYDGSLVASGAEDGSARIWSVETQKCLHTFAYSRVWTVAFSPNKPLLAIGCDDRTTRVFDVETGEMLHILPHENRGVWAVAFSPDGRWLVTGGDDLVIRLWDAETWLNVGVFSGHTNRVRSLSFAPNSKHFVSGSDDQTIIVWDISTGKSVNRLNAMKPYQDMNISKVTGITSAQKLTLLELGAIEN